MNRSDGDEPLGEMTFWDHVDDLRSVLIRAAVVIVALGALFFVMMPEIFDSVILAPTSGDFITYRVMRRLAGSSPLAAMVPGADDAAFGVQLINIKLASQFFIHMSTSFWLAVVFAFPVIIFLLWGFVSPALYSNERRGVRLALTGSTVMFFAGVCTGYFLVFPLTLRFLADYQVSSAVPNVISLESYMDSFLALILIMGLVFELPLAAWLLGRLGVLCRQFFAAYRRHALVVLLVLAAVITPTGDPFTLMVVFIPIYALWEVSALLVPSGRVVGA